MAGHGLVFRSVDLQNADTPDRATIWFDLFNPFEPAEVRGEDQVIPQKPGMVAWDKYKHRRLIDLRGQVQGIGEDREERAESFWTASEALRDIMDGDLSPGTLEWVSPYLGLPAGSQEILCRAIDAVPGPVLNRMSFQRWSFRLVAVADPPEWEATS